MTNLTHDQIQAILLRIEPEFFRDFDTTDWDAFFEFAENREGFERFAVLYAESQHALGEIIERGCYDISPDKRVEDCPACKDHIQIARQALGKEKS